MTNDEIADVLQRIGGLLQAQGAGGYRVRAYGAAAEFARAHDAPLMGVLEREGRAGLVVLPTIGKSIARLIEELARNGRARMLARLEGDATAEALFDSLPGIGAELAEHIHAKLHVETLEQLECAAHDGRLETVPGIGPHRAEMIRNALAARLGADVRARSRAPASRSSRAPARPPVELLLEVDAEYRARAAADDLRRIAPRRFNPSGEAWLPILHVVREGWDLTVLFSNTARAHELDRIHDWVVVYYERDDDEGQCTVVTETRGRRAGMRVVRGREGECREADGARAPEPPTAR
ncbi:MAG: DNA-binding protein [bacterium]|nr:DNA-binding protein [bacterium]